MQRYDLACGKVPCGSGWLKNFNTLPYVFNKINTQWWFFWLGWGQMFLFCFGCVAVPEKFHEQYAQQAGEQHYDLCGSVSAEHFGIGEVCHLFSEGAELQCHDAVVEYVEQ